MLNKYKFIFWVCLQYIHFATTMKNGNHCFPIVRGFWFFFVCFHTFEWNIVLKKYSFSQDLIHELKRSQKIALKIEYK